MDASTRGRIGGLTSWSRNDAETMIGPAHRGFRRRFERLVDPDGRLTVQERETRADRARRAHMLTLAMKSAEVRRRRSVELVVVRPSMVRPTAPPAPVAVTCSRCGGPIRGGSRRDARFCGVKCRVAAHRARKVGLEALLRAIVRWPNQPVARFSDPSKAIAAALEAHGERVR